MDEFILAGERQRGRGFQRVAQAQHREFQSGLGNLAHRRRARFPIVEEESVEGFFLRQWPYPHNGARDEAETPFRAEDHLAQVRAGGRGGMGRQVQRAERSLHVAAGEQALDAPVVVGLLSAGAGSDPAAEGGVFEGLREVAERIAARVESLFDLGAGNARLEGC